MDSPLIASRPGTLQAQLGHRHTCGRPPARLQALCTAHCRAARWCTPRSWRRGSDREPLRRRVTIAAGATPTTRDVDGYDAYTDDEEEAPTIWDEPLEATWEGWDDPTPENFLVVLLSAVTVVSLFLVSLRLGVVLVSIFLTAIKYCFVALLLVCFAVYFA